MKLNCFNVGGINNYHLVITTFPKQNQPRLVSSTIL